MSNKDFLDFFIWLFCVALAIGLVCGVVFVLAMVYHGLKDSIKKRIRVKNKV